MGRQCPLHRTDADYPFILADLESMLQLKHLSLLQVSRSLGYIPLLIWGVMGSPIPKQVPMRLFLGAPIPVRKSDNPSQSEIDETLQKFIEAIKSLYQRHKAEAGYAESVHLHIH